MNDDTEAYVLRHIQRSYSPKMAETVLRLRTETQGGSVHARVMLSDLLRFAAPKW